MDPQPVPIYTRQPPRAPGFYWLKDGDNEDIVEVWDDPNRTSDKLLLFVHQCGSGDVAELSAYPDAFWSGPLLKPASPR